MQFTTLTALFALTAGLVAASPLTPRAGCGATGPLGEGHYEWYIDTACTAGATYACSIRDASGCEPGDVGSIGSVEVDSPDDTTQYASASNTYQVSFVCPDAGQIRCQANFNDNDDGPNYSILVFQQ